MQQEKQKYDEIYGNFRWESFASQYLDWNPAEKLNVAHESIDKHAHDPRKVALYCILPDGRERKYTFRQLKGLSARFAHVLRGLGVHKGDVVARLLPRIPEAYVTWFGTWKVGAIDLPLYTAFGPEAIAHRLMDSGAKIIVTDAENREKLERIQGGLQGVKVIVVWPDQQSHLRTGDISFWRAIEGAPKEFETVPTKAGDIAVLQYTSGTTGLPKGTAIPHHGLLTVLPYPVYLMDVKPDDRVWGFADPGWIYGLFTVGCTLLCLGQPLLVYGPRFDVKNWYEVMKRYKVTNFSAAPTTYRTILAAGNDLPRHYKLKVRRFTSAGELLNPEVVLWFKKHFGVPVSDQYGATEVGMVLGNYPFMKNRPGSMGRPFPGFEVKIMDETGRTAPPGQTNLLCVRKHPFFLSSDYWNQPEKWRERFIEGEWFNTGDLAACDEEGCFYYKGRCDDLISASGLRVGPAEVENSIMDHPAVAEAAVIGKPDPIRGEIIKAFIVLRAGIISSDALAEEIQKAVKEKLSKHCFPREIEFVSELPKTSSGKIIRRELRERS